ncbi:DUF2244 domain-containing protein [Roseomonas sp. F4]
MSAAAEAILFEAFSTPSQSLSARGMRLLCLFSAMGAAVPGGLFLILGAWPVLGFLGVEVTLVLGLVALHRRWAARAWETVQLTERQLRVVTADGRGGRREAVLQPYWTHVMLEEQAGGVARLALVQRNRRVELGGFLSDAEKRDLGEALATALRRYKRPEFDNPQLR